MSEQTTPRKLSRLGQFILARLLTKAKSPPAPSQIKEALFHYFRDRLGLDQSAWVALVEQTLKELEVSGLTVKRVLTDAGRKEALSFLRIQTVPADWRGGPARLLAVACSARDANEAKRVADADGLAGYVANTFCESPLPGVPAAGAALDHFAWWLVARNTATCPPAGTKFTAKNVIAHTLLGGKVDTDQVGPRLAAYLLKTPNARPDTIRTAVINRWLAAEEGSTVQTIQREATATPAAQSSEPSDGDFAETVRQIAERATDGRFGESKVFISRVWNEFHTLPAWQGITRREFDERLIAAGQRNALSLTRADLVAGMPEREVAESEIGSAPATYHFVRTDR